MSRRIAFVWGSNANRHYPPLKYAKRDVERMRGTLSSDRYGFEVRMPKDTGNPHQVHEELLDATAACRPEDVFVAYFSGHGQLDGSRLYLVLDRSVPDETRTMFSSVWLIEALRGCRAKRRLLILDCCHAGAAIGGKSLGVGVAELFPDYKDERILYASDKLEAARELRDFEGSFLTHLLCKFLVGAPPGSVALSQALESLQRAATEHNERAALQHRVPIPYLFGAQRDDFFFAEPAPAQEAPRAKRDSLSGPSGLPPRSAFRRAAASAWLGLRAAASDGQGSYFFTMLAFGLAALFFHDSLALQQAGHDELQQVAGRPEGLQAELHPVVTQMLLPNPKTLDKALRDDLARAYASFQYALKNPVESHPCPSITASGDPAGDVQLPPWTSNDSDSTLIIPGPIASLPLRRAQKGLPPGCEAPRGSSASAGQGTSTRGPDRSRPHTEAARPAATGTVKWSTCTSASAESWSPEDLHLYCAFHEAIDDSYAIRSTREILRAYNDNYRSYERFHIGSIHSLYYVSPEGIIRIRPALSPRSAPTLRALSNPALLHKETAPDPGTLTEVSHTPFYFDPSGDGIVETVCYATQKKDGTRDASASPGPSTPHAHESGLFCADLTPAESAIWAHLREAVSATVEISIVRIYPGTNVAPMVCPDPRTPWPIACNGRLSSIPQDDAVKAASEFQQYFDAGRGPVTKPGEVSPVAGMLGVPIAHHPAANSWDIAVIRLRSSRTRDNVSLALSAVSLITGVTVLVLGFRRKLRRQQSLLARGFHHGLLELSEGRIIGANDRAEEILRTSLPRLGVDSPSVQQARTFAPMIDDTCVLLPSHAGGLSDDDICGYDGRIRDRAADGLTSVFYAWVRRSESWIKVTSTVILLPNDVEHVFCALDTAVDLSHREVLARARARSTRRNTGDHVATAG